VLLIGIVLFAMFVTFFFLTQLFQLVQHRSALAAGLLIVPTSVALTISAGVAGKLIHTVGPGVLALAMTTGAHRHQARDRRLSRVVFEVSLV
jgi:hypothetical protein